MPTTALDRINVNFRPFPADVFRVLELHADYGCANSGKCCREAWNIRVYPHELKHITKTLTEAGMDRREAQTHFIRMGVPEEPNLHTFAHCDSGYCAFLGVNGETSHCKLHAAHGHTILPSTCQTYPRMAVATPAGVFMTLSYTCPTAAKLLLKEDGLRETEPRRVFQARGELQGATFAEDTKAPKFGGDKAPEWAAFNYLWRWAVQWMGRPDLTPAEGLYTLGLMLGQVETHASEAGKLTVLVDLLDQAMGFDAATLRGECERQGPSTELGLIYLDTLLNLSRQVGNMPELFKETHAALAEKGDARRQLGEAYDRLLRPRLAEFALIERNYIASRLYANPLIYRSHYARTGYFLVVLSLLGLRFSVLVTALREGKAIDEQTWVRAVQDYDLIIQHNAAVQTKLIGLLEKFNAADLRDLCAPAMF